MKLISVMLLALLISACSPSYTDQTGEYKLPPELSECKVFKVSEGFGTPIKVVYCKGKTSISSRTSTGKTHSNGVLIY
jgi:hypothetical protein